MEQDSWERPCRTEHDRTGQIGQGNRDGTVRVWHLGQDYLDRTAWKVNLDRTAWTGEPGQSREDKSGHDINARTTASGQRWTRLLGRDSCHRTAGIGQLGYNSWDMTAMTGRTEKTVRTVYPGQETEYKTENRTARTGQGDRTTVAGQLAEDI
jgi:hypothetical protein